MRNLAANFGKILDICKNFSKNLVDERGNMPRRGVIPRLSDLEIIALSLTAEKFSVDSESYLFSLLEEYKSDIPNLISRRQFNDRRKFTANLCEQTPFAKARKRVETLFSQMVDQFMLCRNYAKQQVGLFARIISKVSALTILQYINFINNTPIGRVKYALV
jgi:hypothetical protein